MSEHAEADRDHAEDSQRAQGSTDGPLEDELESAMDRQLGEGVRRVGRGVVATGVTGFFGGSEVAFGVLRSEERRVGKECRSRWVACHSEKKDGTTREMRTVEGQAGGVLGARIECGSART